MLAPRTMPSTLLLAASLLAAQPLAAQLLPAAAVAAAPTPVLAYQGRLLEASLPVTGARTFTFSVLDSSGTELWNSGDRKSVV